MAIKLNLGRSGGRTQSQSMMPGRYAPGYSPPIFDAIPMAKMTKAEARRARKKAKADQRTAIEAGQMRTANELGKRQKDLKKLYA
jgi:hypothetical protein